MRLNVRRLGASLRTVKALVNKEMAKTQNRMSQNESKHLATVAGWVSHAHLLEMAINSAHREFACKRNKKA
jgi:hypothetical protein